MAGDLAIYRAIIYTTQVKLCHRVACGTLSLRSGCGIPWCCKLTYNSIKSESTKLVNETGDISWCITQRKSNVGRDGLGKSTCLAAIFIEARKGLSVKFSSDFRF